MTKPDVIDLGPAPNPDDTAPRKSGTRQESVSDRPPGEVTPPPGPKTRNVLSAAVRQNIQNYYVMLGMAVNTVEMSSALRHGLSEPDHLCGNEIISSSDACTESLVKLAENNPKVKRALEKLSETGAYAGILSAHLPILVAIMANHGPKAMRTGLVSMFGAMEPEPEPEPVPDNTVPFVRGGYVNGS